MLANNNLKTYLLKKDCRIFVTVVIITQKKKLMKFLYRMFLQIDIYYSHLFNGTK